MIFGGFWQMPGFNGTQALENLLKKEGIELEEVMDEENFQSDFKSIPVEFGQFLAKNPKHIKQMIRYVTEEPDKIKGDSGDKSSLFKYPLFASDIFQAQLTEVQEYLFQITEEKKLAEQNEGKKYIEQFLPTSDNDNKIFKIQTPPTNESQQSNQQESNKMQIENQSQIPPQTQQQQQPVVQSGKMEIEQQQKPANDKNQEQQNNQAVISKVQSAENQEAQQESIFEQKSQTQLTKNSEQNFLISRIEEPKKEEIPQELLGNNLLLQLFNYLQADINNQTLAGYFSKAVISLVNKNGDLWQFIEKQNFIIEKLKEKIGIKAISEILIKLISTDGIDNKKCRYFKEQKLSLGRSLFQTFCNTENEEILENICYIFTELIQNQIAPDRYSEKGYEIFINAFMQPDLLDQLIEKLEQLVDDKCISNNTLHSVVNMITQFVQFYTYTITHKPSSNTQTKVPEEEQKEYKSYDQVPLEKLSKMIDIIKQMIEKKDENFLASQSKITPTFGIGRQRLIDLLYYIMKVDHQQVYDKVKQSNIMKTLIDTMFKFEQNDILRNLIDKIFLHITTVNNTTLFEALIQDHYLINQFIQYSDASKVYLEKQKKNIVRPYYAHLIKFSNYLFKGKFKEFLSKISNNDPEFNKYKKFESEILDKVNKIYDLQLGDSNPKLSSEHSSGQKPIEDDDIKSGYGTKMPDCQNEPLFQLSDNNQVVVQNLPQDPTTAQTLHIDVAQTSGLIQDIKAEDQNKKDQLQIGTVSQVPNNQKKEDVFSNVKKSKKSRIAEDFEESPEIKNKEENTEKNFNQAASQQLNLNEVIKDEEKLEQVKKNLEKAGQVELKDAGLELKKQDVHEQQSSQQVQQQQSQQDNQQIQQQSNEQQKDQNQNQNQNKQEVQQNSENKIEVEQQSQQQVQQQQDNNKKN